MGIISDIIKTMNDKRNEHDKAIHEVIREWVSQEWYESNMENIVENDCFFYQIFHEGFDSFIESARLPEYTFMNKKLENAKKQLHAIATTMAEFIEKNFENADDSQRSDVIFIGKFVFIGDKKAFTVITDKFCKSFEHYHTTAGEIIY
jgi:tRNA A22 N-methylase